MSVEGQIRERRTHAVGLLKLGFDEVTREDGDASESTVVEDEEVGLDSPRVQTVRLDQVGAEVVRVESSEDGGVPGRGAVQVLGDLQGGCIVPSVVRHVPLCKHCLEFFVAEMSLSGEFAVEMHLQLQSVSHSSSKIRGDGVRTGTCLPACRWFPTGSRWRISGRWIVLEQMKALTRDSGRRTSSSEIE